MKSNPLNANGDLADVVIKPKLNRENFKSLYKKDNEERYEVNQELLRRKTLKKLLTSTTNVVTKGG